MYNIENIRTRNVCCFLLMSTGLTLRSHQPPGARLLHRLGEKSFQCNEAIVAAISRSPSSSSSSLVTSVAGFHDQLRDLTLRLATYAEPDDPDLSDLQDITSEAIDLLYNWSRRPRPSGPLGPLRLTLLQLRCTRSSPSYYNDDRPAAILEAAILGVRSQDISTLQGVFEGALRHSIWPERLVDPSYRRFTYLITSAAKIDFADPDPIINAFDTYAAGHMQPNTGPPTPSRVMALLADAALVSASTEPLSAEDINAAIWWWRASVVYTASITLRSPSGEQSHPTDEAIHELIKAELALKSVRRRLLSQPPAILADLTALYDPTPRNLLKMSQPPPDRFYEPIWDSSFSKSHLVQKAKEEYRATIRHAIQCPGAKAEVAFLLR